MKALLEKLNLRDLNAGACFGADGWIEDPDGQELVSYNPATGEAIARIRQATPGAYEAVMRRAVERFQAWRLVPAPRRGLLVRDLGTALREMKEPLGELVTLGVRVLHIEYFRPELPEQSYLLADYRRAGHMAAMRLMLGGCREFRFAGMGQAPYEVLLEKGFAEALTEHGAGYDRQRQFFRFPMDIDADASARRAVSAFLKRLPSGAGLFCRSIEMAEGILSCAGQMGLRAPRDFRLAAFDWSVPAKAPGYELICCDRMALVRRAVDLVTAPSWTGVRELVAPKLFVASLGES